MRTFGPPCLKTQRITTRINAVRVAAKLGKTIVAVCKELRFGDGVRVEDGIRVGDGTSDGDGDGDGVDHRASNCSVIHFMNT